MKRFIGCGTGRCGTRSLARLIDGCKDWHCTHEMKPILPWREDKELVDDRIKYFQEHDEVGDVAFYYLPHLERLLREVEGLKVVGIRRDKEETIESFMRKVPNRNHWVNHNGSRWRIDRMWDKCFPNLGLEVFFSGEKLKRESIREYWLYYYEQMEYLSDGYPGRVKIYPIDVLNDRGLQEDMFDFIGIDNPNLQVGLKLNETQ